MNAAPPKFRNDLKIRRNETAEGVWYIIKDPVTHKFFRFREAEHFIAGQFDGETPPEVVRERTEEKFGGTLPSETLSAFIGTLDTSGLLDNENSGKRKKSGKSREKRLQGTLTYLRYKILDPARILDWLIHRVRFFFTPGFVVSAFVLIAFSTLITIENFSVFVADIPRLWELEAIPLFLVLGFLVISLHEFGHGLTCRHFGGRVREMGFMLIYFQPALYCNVSDAWLFPERAKRLWVGFAGMFFELFVWAIAVLAWRVTDNDTAINYASLMVMTGSGISTLANLNPLIKLDGYYLLSDYLNIPNLRKKSFRYFGDMLKSVVGLAERPGAGFTERERRIFFTYGSIATVGSLSIMTFMTFEIGAFLIEQSQVLALSLFLALVGTRFRTRITRIFGKSNRSDEDFDDGLSPTLREEDRPTNGSYRLRPSEPPTPRVEVTGPAPAKVPPPPDEPPEPKRDEGKRKSSRSSKSSRRKRKRRLNPVLLGIVGFFLLQLLFFGWMELRIGGPFNILPIEYVDVRAEVDGVLEDVAVKEGDMVDAGDVIARISEREHRAELQQVEAEIERAYAELKILETGPTPAEVELAKATISRASDRLRFERARVDRSKLLYEKDILSLTEYETAQQQLNTAENDMIEAEKRYIVLMRGIRPEQIQSAKAGLAGLQAQRRILTENLRRVDVRSPVSGIVVTPARQLHEMLYQRADKGALIARISNSRKLTVEIAVSEKDIGDVKVGNAVAFKARAFPDTTFYGVVVATAQTAAVPANQQANATANPMPTSTPTTVLVRTEIDNGALLLKSGMTGYAKIYCGERRVISLILRRIAQTIKVEFWSWW